MLQVIKFHFYWKISSTIDITGKFHVQSFKFRLLINTEMGSGNILKNLNKLLMF